MQIKSLHLTMQYNTTAYHGQTQSATPLTLKLPSWKPCVVATILHAHSRAFFSHPHGCATLRVSDFLARCSWHSVLRRCATLISSYSSVPHASMSDSIKPLKDDKSNLIRSRASILSNHYWLAHRLPGSEAEVASTVPDLLQHTAAALPVPSETPPREVSL